jgi:hypothetical protein
MIANLYLHPDTFVYNKKDSKEQVEAKVSALVDDMTRVVCEYGAENRFKVPMALSSTYIYNELTIIDIAEQCLSHDCKGVFYTMIADTSDEYDDIPIDELREKCIYHEDEKEINTLLVFNVPTEDLTEEEKALSEEEAKKCHQTIIRDYIKFDKYEVVYNKQTWQYLRRQILGNHPGNPSHFIEECRKYFPNLCFSNNCVSSLKDLEYNYLETSPRKLVYYLSCLNDKFSDIQNKHKLKGSDANTILKDFSGLYGLDESGSLQQRPEKKALLTFKFQRNDKTSCDVICEPHLKISKEDSNCKVKNIDYSKFHPRIYFCFANSDIENGRIPVGSVGKHI